MATETRGDTRSSCRTGESEQRFKTNLHKRIPPPAALLFYFYFFNVFIEEDPKIGLPLPFRIFKAFSGIPGPGHPGSYVQE